MDVTKILEADHREAEALFEQIPEAKGGSRQPLIDQLATSLRSHMQLEEDVLYPAMEPATGAEEVEEANNEHALAKKLITEMLALAPDEPGFDGALEALKAGIEHHVEEEETEVFPQLRRDATILDKVATPFMTKRVELKMPINVEALAAASTKEELLGEATNAGVENASSMTKDELAGALVEHMAAG